MMYQIKLSRLIVFILALLMAPIFTVHTFAEDAEEKNPLRFYNGPKDSYLQITAKAEIAYFNSDDAWFGESVANIGVESEGYWESTFRPGLEGKFFTSAGELYGRADALYASTDDIDAAGSNVGFGDVSEVRMENAYAGWRSGDVFDSLGKNFLDISFGRQQYIAGTGFLFHSESSNGKDRGAYWMGARKSADYAGIARMNYEQLTTDVIFLKADDNINTDTKAGGITVDYNFDQVLDKLGSVGGGYYKIESDTDSRDSMDVFDARFCIFPFLLFDQASALSPLKLEAEYVYEEPDSDFDEGNGWYVSCGYQFAQIPWTPTLSYRYASFDENYDPLFYGFNDWGSWYQGEILGEYALSNSNLDSHMIKLNILPLDPVSINLFYYTFKLHDSEASGLSSDDYADEMDITVDWSVNKHLSVSLVGATADPKDGAEEQTGGDSSWKYMMLYANVSF
jgi:hypothetical protein